MTKHQEFPGAGSKKESQKFKHKKDLTHHCWFENVRGHLAKNVGDLEDLSKEMETSTLQLQGTARTSLEIMFLLSPQKRTQPADVLISAF